MEKIYKIKLILIIFTATILTSSCSRKIVNIVNDPLPVIVDNNEKEKVKNKPSDPIEAAEYDASVAGKKVLAVGRKMVFEEKKIVKGSCWDYINEVYRRAGYSSDKKTVFKSKKSGPYVDVSKIQPGDWLYYINHSYNGVEHSGIFVYWKDYKNKIGVTLSYGGQNRNEPGRYKEYDLRSVYNIMRPGAE